MPDLETTLVPWLDINGVSVFHGDCVGVMAAMPDASVDAIVTDPPYGIEFMGNAWDAPWKSGVHAEARRRRSDEMGDEAKRPFIAAGVSAYRAGPAFQEWCRRRIGLRPTWSASLTTCSPRSTGAPPSTG